MGAWLESLTTLQTVFFFIALPATVFLVIQTILVFVGIGGDQGELDSDVSGIGDNVDLSVDLDGDGIPDAVEGVAEHSDIDGLRLFSVRGIISFLAVGGWAGFAVSDGNMQSIWAIIIAIVVGFAALVIVALIMKGMYSLQTSGTLNYNNAIGRTGEVYLPIGGNNSKTGKIALEVQGRFVEMDAMTRDERTLKVGEPIKVIGMLTESIAIVEPLVKESQNKYTI